MDDEKWGFGVPVYGTVECWYGPYDTREEAEADALRAYLDESPSAVTGYVIGRMVRYSPFLEDDVIFDYLYEDAEEQLGVWPPYGELAPDDARIFDQIDVKRDELAKYVSRAIRSWMDENGIATDRLVMERDPEFVEVAAGGVVE